MISNVKTLKKADRQTAMDQLSQHLGGADPNTFPMFSEQYGGNDLSFSALKPDNFKAEDFPAIVQRTYDIALYRDAVYAHLNRGQLMALAANNEFRTHYEASRIAALSGIDSEEASA